MSELKNLENKADTLYKCHNTMAKRYKVISEIFNISVIIISGVMSTFLPLIEEDTELINSILGYIITLITAIKLYYKPSDKHNMHRLSSQGYISLKSKIRQKIIKGENENDNDLIQVFITKFEKKRKDSPFISNSLYDKKYKTIVKEIV